MVDMLEDSIDGDQVGGHYYCGSLWYLATSRCGCFRWQIPRAAFG